MCVYMYIYIYICLQLCERSNGILKSRRPTILGRWTFTLKCYLSLSLSLSLSLLFIYIYIYIYIVGYY